MKACYGMYALTMAVVLLAGTGCGDRKMRARVAALDDKTLTEIQGNYPPGSKPAILIAEELRRRQALTQGEVPIPATCDSPVNPATDVKANAQPSQSPGSAPARKNGKIETQPSRRPQLGAFARPTMSFGDDKARVFHEKWQDCLSRADIKGILVASTSDWENASLEMQNGIMPWITVLEATNGTYYVSPNGLLKDGHEGHAWVNVREQGTAAVKIERNIQWQTVAFSGMNGWFRSTEGKNVNFINKTEWLRVPETLSPKQELRITTTFNGPPDEKGSGSGVDTYVYTLLAVAAPKPDQPTVLNLWAYVISEGSESGSGFGESDEEAVKRLSALDAVLRDIRTKVSESEKALLDKLMSHSAYETRVRKHLTTPVKKP